MDDLERDDGALGEPEGAAHDGRGVDLPHPARAQLAFETIGPK